MSGWAAKRFWKAATVVAVETGFEVALDGRRVKTPAKSPLILPTRALAEAVAAEWQAQETTIAPESMPCTRSANAAIDKVTPQRTEVAQLIAAYGDSDLLCYRAEGPEALVARQAKAWDPMLDWAASALGARLSVAAGVIHIAQPAESLAVLDAAVAEFDAFELTALHDLVALSGSLVLGLAASHGVAPAEDLWNLSRVDEDWQVELWGADEEAAENAALRRAAFLHAARFLQLVRSPG